MDFHVLTLFPDMIGQAANTSIMGRAVQNGHIRLDIINIRDFSANKHNRVDDYPYGGGAGMVMEAEPVFRAVEEAKRRSPGKTRVIYLTPQAEVLSQTRVEELAGEESLILLCGHYEGIDDRVLQEVVTDYISIGDYVLTGGELGALVLMDAVSRFVPGVLSNDESSYFESHQDNLLEYPHYTRPRIWHDREVPAVLLTGDHRKITEWRYEQSLKRTAERRPDLLKKSYAVKVISFGSEKSGRIADGLAARLSGYSTTFDLNRAKLQRSGMKLEKNDMAVFVFDNEPEMILRNVCADGTPAFIVSDKGGAYADFLKSKGFIPAGEFIQDEDEEAIKDTALHMRINMEKLYK